MNDANEENNHNNSTHNLNEISAPRWPKGVSCHGYVWERERERVSHLLSHFDLISSSKLAFDEKVTFDWMISLVLMLFVYGCLMSKWLYWPIATKSFVAISFKCTLLTYRNKKFCCNKFSKVLYCNKNYCCNNLSQQKFCCNKL